MCERRSDAFIYFGYHIIKKFISGKEKGKLNGEFRGKFVLMCSFTVFLFSCYSCIDLKNVGYHSESTNLNIINFPSKLTHLNHMRLLPNASITHRHKKRKAVSFVKITTFLRQKPH